MEEYDIKMICTVQFSHVPGNDEYTDIGRFCVKSGKKRIWFDFWNQDYKPHKDNPGKLTFICQGYHDAYEADYGEEDCGSLTKEIARGITGIPEFNIYTETYPEGDVLTARITELGFLFMNIETLESEMIQIPPEVLRKAKIVLED